MADDKKVLLSVRNLEVKFHVRGRVLTAIRNIYLDIYDGESIAIVGESGSGKSVFTKTFAGMLDENGFISEGSLIFKDEELMETNVALDDAAKKKIESTYNILNRYSKYEYGVDLYNQINALKAEKIAKESLTEEEAEEFDNKIQDLVFERTELFNTRLTYDPAKEKDLIASSGAKLKEYDAAIAKLQAERKAIKKAKEQAVRSDLAYMNDYNKKLLELKTAYNRAVLEAEVSEEKKNRNLVFAKEIYLSVGRYSPLKRAILIDKLTKSFKESMIKGLDLARSHNINATFDKVIFRVKYLDETDTNLHGTCIVDLAKVKYGRDWQQVRGRKVATVFQDPMSSLNPIITIGKQITSVILNHQNCSEMEARAKAVDLMKKVGIPNAESRFDDYPFQYSGGMRQRIVIAIALSCQPKILICDEPTTALDVTIQAQILRLIKDLQKEFNYTIVFITHDLGVVANIADRVAVLYAGQVVEVGTVEDVFYDPRHPYTWALLSSLPQLAVKGEKLYSISGTPPSLYNKIIGDPFAPRNPYCLKIDTLKDSPMFKISETHSAKTWLLDERAPKIEKPAAIQNIHEKLMNAFNVEEVND